VLEHDLIAALPRLRRYARALAGDPVRADDLVQDTLERAWAKADLFRPGSDLRAWLFTLMHNVFVNGVRGRLVEMPAADFGGPADNRGREGLEPGDPLASMADPRAVAEADASVADIGRALGRLPEEQRAAILLVVLEDMSYEDIARIQQVPVGTVMSRLARARERLRLLLDSGSAVPLRVVK
jgi:RNA polymerase sigma-70 factor (ECF subfamily)